jgi:hypothetical protein
MHLPTWAPFNKDGDIYTVRVYYDRSIQKDGMNPVIARNLLWHITSNLLYFILKSYHLGIFQYYDIENGRKTVIIPPLFAYCKKSQTNIFSIKLGNDHSLHYLNISANKVGGLLIDEFARKRKRALVSSKRNDVDIGFTANVYVMLIEVKFETRK